MHDCSSPLVSSVAERLEGTREGVGPLAREAAELDMATVFDLTNMALNVSTGHFQYTVSS